MLHGRAEAIHTVRCCLPGAILLPLVAVAALVSVAAGCDAPHDASLPPVEVKDSLGVEILTFDRDLLPPSIRIPDEPVLVVGEGSEQGTADLPLDHVVDALLLTERLLFIIEAGTQEIIRVDLATNGIQRFGGNNHLSHPHLRDVPSCAVPLMRSYP
jgi:hypothetical protein